MLGDSIIRHLRFSSSVRDKIWTKMGIVNAGVRIDRVENVLYRIQNTVWPTSGVARMKFLVGPSEGQYIFRLGQGSGTYFLQNLD